MDGTGYSAVMMPDPSRPMAALRLASIAVLALLVASCAQHPSRPAPAKAPAVAAIEAPKGESESLMAGEMALRDGNCHVASESYLAAAKVSKEVRVASRAAEIALGCSQLDTARAATARWRELDPWNGEASLAAALVALKRYDLAEARKALIAWRDSGSAGSQDPLQFAEAMSAEADATALYRGVRGRAGW